MLARELEPNRKLFPDHLPFHFHGALLGAGSLWPDFVILSNLTPPAIGSPDWLNHRQHSWSHLKIVLSPCLVGSSGVSFMASSFCWQRVQIRPRTSQVFMHPLCWKIQKKSSSFNMSTKTPFSVLVMKLLIEGQTTALSIHRAHFLN